MVMTVEGVQTAPSPQSRGRRRWYVVAAALALLVAGTVTTVTTSLRYAHAAPLECACGLTWAPPDSVQARQDHAGPWTASSVPARPGHQQSFYVMITNPAPVTQTILGLPSTGGPVLEPTQLAVAQRSATAVLDQADPTTLHYLSGPVSIPPHGIRWLRYTVTTAPARYRTTGQTETWSELVVRVRVGPFIRTETIGFPRFAFELRD